MRFFKKDYYTKSDLPFLKKEKRYFALKHHPDKGGKEKDFKAMMDEYETIENTVNTSSSFGSPKVENISNESTSSMADTKPSESHNWYEKKEFIDYLINDYVPFKSQTKLEWLFSYMTYRIIIYVIFFLWWWLCQYSIFLFEVFISFAFILAFLTGRFWVYFFLLLFILKLSEPSPGQYLNDFDIILWNIGGFWSLALPVLGFIHFSVFWKTSDEKPDFGDLGKRIKKMI